MFKTKSFIFIIKIFNYLNITIKIFIKYFKYFISSFYFFISIFTSFPNIKYFICIFYKSFIHIKFHFIIPLNINCYKYCTYFLNKNQFFVNLAFQQFTELPMHITTHKYLLHLNTHFLLLIN